MARPGIEALFPFESGSEAETISLGRRLGALLQAGDVVALSGDLGAGKTHFVKGIASAFDVDMGDVSSPTFTIAHEYAGRVPIFHLDLYRLTGLGDARRAGLEEYMMGDGICLVEWPGRAPDLLPPDTIIIRMMHRSENERVLDLGPVNTI